MRTFSTTISKIAGFTLVELMMSMAIGAFLIGGVFKVYINGRATQDVIEVQTQLIDDARFSLNSLSYDLRHAGLWGKTNNDSQIARALGTDPATGGRVPELGTAMPDLVGDCAIGWYRDLNQSFYVSENINPYADTCIPKDSYVEKTDVLVVKYAPPTAIPDANLIANVVYIYANHFHGELFIGPTAPQFKRDLEGQVPQNYRLKSRAYFVNTYTDYAGDDYPSLHRIELAVGPSIENTMLIPGVEDFQVQLGYDKDNDRSVDMYVDGNSAELDGDNNLVQVKSVQYWVLLRSRYQELPSGESQSISLAGREVKSYSDGYRRVVMSTVIKLQNRMQKITAAGG